MFYEKYDHKVDAFVEKAMAEIKKHYVVFKRMKRDLYSGSFNTFICASSLYSCIFIYPLRFTCFTLIWFHEPKRKRKGKRMSNLGLTIGCWMIVFVVVLYGSVEKCAVLYGSVEKCGYIGRFGVVGLMVCWMMHICCSFIWKCGKVSIYWKIWIVGLMVLNTVVSIWKCMLEFQVFLCTLQVK
ncbi:hypothetical protein IC582_004988 [Cucumis melo]